MADTQSLEVSTDSTGAAQTNVPAGCRTTISRSDYGEHIVEPPTGGMNLVCCQTTKGVWNIAVHPDWAPIGAGNFMTMVTSGFFTTRVPLFRALKGFLIQFGLNSQPGTQKEYEKEYLGGRGGKMRVARLIGGDQPPSPPADGQESRAVLRHSRRDCMCDVIEAFGRRVE